MKTSVVIPTFNSERYIQPLLESLENQSRRPDEVVISDDASTDDTIALIEEQARSSNISYKILRHSPDGISANYENAFFASTGEIVIVGDHDDVWLPDKIALIQSAFIDHADVSVVATDSVVVDENLTSLGTTLRGGKKVSERQAQLAAKDDFKFFLMGARMDAHTLATRGKARDILKDAGLGKIPGLWFENRLCAAALCFGRLKYLPDAVTLYRQHSLQHVGFTTPSLEKALKRNIEVKLERLGVLRELLEKNQFQSRLPQPEVQRRIQLLDEYVTFLKMRELDGRTSIKFLRLMLAFSQGDYVRFSTRPLKSLVKDLLQILPINPLKNK